MRTLTQLRHDSRLIFDSGLRAVDPVEAIKRHIRAEGERLKVNGCTYDLSQYRNLYVLGAGKAAAAMARGVEELLGDRINGGLVIVKEGHLLPLSRVGVVEAGHPVPDDAGVAGTKRIMDIIEMAGAEDLVVFLLSGGGSALLPCPAAGLSLKDKQRTTQILLDCGATIHEINAMRKHISRVKGGRLARLAFPATVVSLVLSDVIGDSLDTIASGPMVPDPSTYSDCLAIIERYQIEPKIAASVKILLKRGAAGEVEETPKAGDPVFEKVQNVIVGSNRQALEAAKQKALELGYNTSVLSSTIEGETRIVAGVHTAIAKEILASNNPISRPACIISGGETTVTIRGAGLGGRNQEFALAAAIDIDQVDGVVVLSGGTDGTDGPTPAAGGIVDGFTLKRGRENDIDAKDFLQRNDSHHFLKATKDLLMTGPTLTNVMDLRVVLVA